MIEKELFELLQQQYSPIISDIINSDVEFYRTNQTIRWKFGYDERVAIFAWCNRKTNIVTVNIAAVDFALQQNEPLDIEYFLLHEIRHIYQHLEIEDYTYAAASVQGIRRTNGLDYNSRVLRKGRIRVQGVG